MTVSARWGIFSVILGLTAAILIVWFIFGRHVFTGNADTAGGSEPAWFADVTIETGLDFVHDPGPIDGNYKMTQMVGSGAALFDFDNDGRLDLLLLQNAGPTSKSKNRLYHQQPDGTFKDVSAGSGVDFAGYCMGVAVGDVNNDGLPDVYISEYLGGRLFLNQGNGKFREVIGSGIDNPMWGTAVSFFDYDRDGWLDLVVVNYVDLNPAEICKNIKGLRDYCGPQGFQGTVTRLYRNRGTDANGKWLGYEDRTDPAGFGKTPGPGLGVLCADFDGDGWSDIFVANDGKANHLWINQRDGTFKEEAVQRGLAFNSQGDTQGNMGVAYGDVDGSGLPSLFVTHLHTENHGLWKQGPRGVFREQAAATGLTQVQSRRTGFGTVLADFDQDGALDLAVANGGILHLGPPTATFWEGYAMSNQLFANNGKGLFRDISAHNPALCGVPNVARGLAVGDLNGDGALDLVVMKVGGPAQILRNVAPRRGHWLMVQARDPALKRDAYGAEVRIHAGTRQWQRLIQPSTSYLCSNDPRAHFGLGAVDRVEAIDVLWPDGREERFSCPKVDCVVVVERGKGEAIKGKGSGAP